MWWFNSPNSGNEPCSGNQECGSFQFKVQNDCGVFTHFACCTVLEKAVPKWKTESTAHPQKLTAGNPHHFFKFHASYLGSLVICGVVKFIRNNNI